MAVWKFYLLQIELFYTTVFLRSLCPLLCTHLHSLGIWIPSIVPYRHHRTHYCLTSWSLAVDTFYSSFYMASTQRMNMDRLSVLTLNTNGIRSAPKRRALFKKLRNMKTDFIMLQEIHSTTSEEKIWLTEWGSGGVFSHGVSNSRGVCILFNRECDFKVIHTIKDEDGRFLIIQVEQVGGSKSTPSSTRELWTLVNIYAPTSNEPANQSAVLAKVYNHLANLEVQSLIIGGDFNIQMDEDNRSSEPHIARGSTSRNEYLNQIHAILEEYNLTDIWKAKHPTSKKGTFHRNKYSARLDYFRSRIPRHVYYFNQHIP